MTLSELVQVVLSIHCESYPIRLYQTDTDHPYLQVEFSAADSKDSRKRVVWKGRKWYLSWHMTKSEVVQTALKACLTAAEHEVRENFKYKGRAIFGPHFDVEDLVELCDLGREDVRPPMPPKKVYKGVTCRGSYLLGSACGHCEKCHEEYDRLYATGRLSEIPERKIKPSFTTN